MIIARDKKKTNIAEYVLYMWQVEDMIRACQFNIDTIEQHIIKQMKLEPLLHEESVIWYNDLVEKMRAEKILQKGHLDFVIKKVQELEGFHKNLIDNKDEIKYRELYTWAKPNIDELKKKSGSQEMGDVYTSLTGLYGILMLRLKKQEVSFETSEAMKTISNFLAYLSAHYTRLNPAK